MKIEISEDELEKLMTLSLIGNFVINGVVEEDEFEEDYHKVIDHLVTQAEDLELPHLFQDTDEGKVPGFKSLEDMDKYLDRFFKNSLEAALAMDDDEDFDMDDMDESQLKVLLGEETELVTKK